MKIYVACHCQDTARNVAVVLSTAGHEITSRWLHADFKPTDQHREPDRPVIAQEDFDDVAAADALVLVAGPDRYPGGKFVETGIALGMGKHVVVIGRRENMLIWLPAIQQVDDPQGAVDYLASLSASPSPVDSRDGRIRKAGQVAIDELIDRMDGKHPGNDDLADYMGRIVDACVLAAKEQQPSPLPPSPKPAAVSEGDEDE